MAVPIFSNNFSQTDWYKFGTKMAVPQFFPIMFPKKTATNLEWPKMAVLKFFPTIFPKRTGINLEWPKMAILNFFQ